MLDVFSGTSRVGHAMKALGWRVTANDHNAFAATLARCYVQADAEDVGAEAERLIQEFNRLPGVAGYFTETFCRAARYVQPFNGERIDAVREAIARKGLEPELEAVVLTALVEAADRVDSTTGLQMAYLKRWAPRSFQPLVLRPPAVLPRARAGKGAALNLEAEEAAGLVEAEVAYVDPPYNQHSYLGNYHVWESLVRWDKPAVYGVARKRVDVRERRSGFNSRVRCAESLRRVIAALRVRRVVVSFSDEGFVTRAELEGMLSAWAGGEAVRVMALPYPRYVGAKIGIYNPSGEKVGRVGKLWNTEYVFVAERGGHEPGVRHTGIGRDEVRELS